MPEKEECLPGEGYIKEVLENVVRELLLRASDDIGHPLFVKVELYKNGTLVRELGKVASMKSMVPHPQGGELRIRFRKTFYPERFQFFIDSIFPEDKRVSSFSGFFARGVVRFLDERYESNYKSWAVKHFDREWKKWL